MVSFKKFIIALLLLIFTLQQTNSLPNILRMGQLLFPDAYQVNLFVILFSLSGAIFRDNEEEQETAFRFAIEKINDDATVLPGVTLVAHVERVSAGDSFGTEKKSNFFAYSCFSHL